MNVYAMDSRVKPGNDRVMKESTTHFGFRNVAEGEKQTLVRGVFDAVATRYDLMNDFMSAGLHRVWKEAMVDALHPRPGMHLLDVAGGTGDIAFRALAREPALQVTLADINAAMLTEGRARSIDRNILHGVSWACGNAEAMPFPDASFDAYTIAFGIRNVTHIDRALSEAKRVLKPGGHFLCLEFSTVPSELMGKIYDWYSFNIIPRVGKAVTGDGAPYQYLVESIRKFPAAEKFERMIKEAGFARTSFRRMSGGVVALHSGWRI